MVDVDLQLLNTAYFVSVLFWGSLILLVFYWMARRLVKKVAKDLDLNAIALTRGLRYSVFILFCLLVLQALVYAASSPKITLPATDITPPDVHPSGEVRSIAPERRSYQQRLEDLRGQTEDGELPR